MQTSTTSYNNRKINQYLTNEINNVGPAQLIIKVYDFAILNCQRHNMIKTNEAIQVLINALNFENEAAREISIGLIKLYQFCQEQMRKKNYDEVYKILSELKETWQTALTNR